ncbi:MAG: phosphate-selective porin [Myxococcaceae bacterium]|nr:phosphate-selective porin [Myxococcaceae bacterium]
MRPTSTKRPHRRGTAIGALAFALANAASTQAFAQDDDDIVVPANPRPEPAPAAAPPAPATPPPVPSAAPPVPAAAPASDAVTRLAALLEPYTVTGYMQGEYQSSAASQDQLAQGGVPLNRDRFVLRRARVRIDGEYEYAALQMEADGNTSRGPQLRVLHAFGTLKLPGKEPKLPLAAATIGLFDTPFGYELVEWPRVRWFMERSTSSQAFFPAEPDLGVRLHGALSFVRWDIAAMNGEPLENRNGYPGLSPRAAKDVVFRVGIDTKPTKAIDVSGHVSGLRGKGFHPGTDGTKGNVQWKDANEDGAIQPVELSGVPATAATPSQLFERWAVGADLQVKLRTRLGQSMVYGEVTIAKNMDRGLFLADPVLTGTDSRELGYYVGIVQEVTRWGIVGFRFDHYDPNADFFDKRGGKLIPTSQAIDTFSPIVGLVLPDPNGIDRARLLLQYDFIRDKLARDARGLPTDLDNDVLTLRLQVSL